MPFRDVTAHRRIVELLSRSISRGALPPSLIFAGPHGTGKRQTAIAVAQVLNCTAQQRDVRSESQTPNPESLLDACGECAQCTRIARGLHPDVPILEPGETGTIKIDQIRDVVGRAAYRPFEGRRRVVIVDDAETMVVAAQNALLKTLEEPSSSSVFVLIATRPDALLPTVRSRCIRLLFAEGARHQVDSGAAAVAQRVLQVASSGGAAQRLDGAKELLTKTGGSAASDREQVASHLKAMAALLRDIEVIATHAAGIELANPDSRPLLERLASAYHGERAVRAFAAIDEALAAIDRNQAIKSVADWVVLQL